MHIMNVLNEALSQWWVLLQRLFHFSAQLCGSRCSQKQNRLQTQSQQVTESDRKVLDSKLFHFHRGQCWAQRVSQHHKQRRKVREIQQGGRRRGSGGVGAGEGRGSERHGEARGAAEKLRENVIWSGCFGPHAPFALPHGAAEWRASAGIESVD